MCAHIQNKDNVTKLDPLDKLIQIEWDMIEELKTLLVKSKFTRDKVRISNSLAYHVNCLNKLLAQKGESPLEDENLGSLLTKIPKKWQFLVLRDIKRWRRKSLLIV